MTKLLVVAAICFSVISLAQSERTIKASLAAQGFAGKGTEAVGRVFVYALSDGKIQIHNNDDISIEELPVVLRDDRRGDGGLTLKVGIAELSVGSMMTPSGVISYGLKIRGEDIELKPIVLMNTEYLQSN